MIEYASEESKYNKSFLYTEILISLSNYVSIHFPHLQGIEYCKNLSKDLFQNLRELNYIWSFKLKTKEYDYTKLVKLLNFPQEFSCYGSKGEEVRYKLNGTSYDLYIWDTDNKVWVNYKELVETE